MAMSWAAPEDTSLVDVFDRLASSKSASQLAVCGGCGDGEIVSLSWSKLREVSLAVAVRISAELVAMAASGGAPSRDAAVALLARRSPLWLAATVGIMRCRRPFVWMGAGELPPQKRHVEASRNGAILDCVSPVLVLLGGSVPPEVIPDWERASVCPQVLPLTAWAPDTSAVPSKMVAAPPLERDATLCYMLTGGTTGSSKCVQVTHAMALYEVGAYPGVFPELSAQDRVLQHTPVLWAASALGQLDIALAFGATVCVANTLDQETVIALGVTVLGTVPSALEALEPSALPQLRCVFTWGEAMSRVLARRWRQAHIRMVELLISTEYWLSFYNDGETSENGQAVYKVVKGTDVAVLPSGEEKPSRDPGLLGELCLRGPMVTTRGYLSSDDVASAFVKAADGGPDYFRTRDLVRVLGSGESRRLEFCGRSDQLVKVAGQFVDLAAAEQQLRAALSPASSSTSSSTQVLSAAGNSGSPATPGGSNVEVEAAILPAPPTSGGPAAGAGPGAPPSAHAFVVLGRHNGPTEVSAALARIRGALPRGAALHLVKGPLPRDALTGKVDRRQLLSSIEGVAPVLPAAPAIRARCKQYPQWWSLIALAGVLDVPQLFRIFTATAVPSLPGMAMLLQGMLHFASVPYLWLLSMYFPKQGLLRNVQSVTPFGRLGMICLLHQVARRSGRRSGHRLVAAAPRLARVLLILGTAAGMALAQRRRRLAQWWLTFWMAIPDSMNQECGYWLKTEAWFWFADQIVKAVQDAPVSVLAILDWAIAAVPRLPAQALALVNHLKAVREPPAELPAALRDDCWVMPAARDESGVEALTPALASPWVDVQQEDRPASRVTASFPPGWDLIWHDCMADVSETVDINISADALPPQINSLPLVGDVTLEAEGKVSSSEPTSAPGEVLEAQTLGGDAWSRYREGEPFLVEPDRALSGLTSTVGAEPGASAASGGWSCKLCGCILEHGSEWRSEDGGKTYLCKPCLRDLDNDWWHGSSRDTIDMPELEDGCLLYVDNAMTDATGPPAKAASSTGVRLLQLLSKHFSGAELRTDSSLAGVDSLAVLSLCRALRAQSNLKLLPTEVFGCTTIGELLRLVEDKVQAQVSEGGTPSDAQSSNASAREREYAMWFNPGQYTSTCKWLYGCRGLLEPSCFRTAAARLIARHETLHSGLCDGESLGVELCKFLRDVTGLQATVWPAAFSAVSHIPGAPLRRAATELVKALQAACAWSLMGSWPKVAPQRLTQEFLDERVHIFRCRSWKEVDEETNRLKNSFTPPFIMALFLLEDPWDYRQGRSAGADAAPHEWGSPSSFVQFIVSHAYSDGYCSVPLVQDFGALLARAWSAEHQQPLPVQQTELAPLPSGATLHALEERFQAALEGRPKWSHPDQMSFRSTCFDGSVPSWRPPWIYTHDVLLESGGVAALRRCGKQYSVPFDVMLLGLVMAAMFRASAHAAYVKDRRTRSESSTETTPLHLTLYAPMRDGDLNDAMVGLFSDWRDVTIPCSGHSTVLGFCLDLATVIRHRRWTVFDPIANIERILVNILPLDEQARGAQSFRQTRAHEYRGRRNGTPQERRSFKGQHRPMRITLEQEAHDAWWMVFDVNANPYPPAWFRCFVHELRGCLEDLARRPLEAVLPVRKNPTPAGVLPASEKL